MTDIIHLLPDSIANQIAAGEVIQRPASVVKELVENAIDAKASHIRVVIKDAGRTLIQVIDNGIGMSATDARMAFERHATSKIKNADDLFALATMGFRGEALPSIAAIAQVEIKTRREEDEVGTFLSISGSKVEKQEAISCAQGSSISVKNIFFNVPARRKFLKSNETERRNIMQEIERIVLVNPSIEFTLIENDVQSFYLPAANLRQRIVQMMGKHLNAQLIDIEIKTSLGEIHGYISKPENARKGRANQYFFANGRYMRHPYFHRAVMTAFEPLISSHENPHYFIYFKVDPTSIDVNIHPTKTELKFENEQAIWQILMATVKESLGKFNAVPSIDFDTKDAIDIPIFDVSKSPMPPKVSINPNYNPFQQAKSETRRSSLNWESLYKGFHEEQQTELDTTLSKHDTLLFEDQQVENSKSGNFDASFPQHYQYKQRYILTSVKSGLMCIDQHRAHVRVLFDKYIDWIKRRRGSSQRILFPEMLELTTAEAAMLPSIIDDLEAIGFELNDLGNSVFVVQSVPSEIENINPAATIHSMIEKSIETGSDIKSEVQETIALSLAKLTAIPYGKILSSEEMSTMVDQLFATSAPNHTPEGQKIISIFEEREIEKRMK